MLARRSTTLHSSKRFWGFFSPPRVQCESLSAERRDDTDSDARQFGLIRTLVLALVPAISFLIGLTQVGWSFSGAEFNPVAFDVALPLALVFYALIIIFTLLMSYFTFIMQRNHGKAVSFSRCLLFVSYTATPMFMAGLVGFIPIIWLCAAALLIAGCYSIYLLYIGIPIYMNIDEGKGFVVSTAVVGAGLCLLIVFKVLTISVWLRMF